MEEVKSRRTRLSSQFSLVCLSLSPFFLLFFTFAFRPLFSSRPQKKQGSSFTSKRTRFLVVHQTIDHARNAHSFNHKRTRARKSSSYQRVVVVCASVDINTAVFLSTHSRFSLKSSAARKSENRAASSWARSYCNNTEATRSKVWYIKQ